MEHIRQIEYNGGMGKSKPMDFAKLFSALADPTRLRLLNLMNGREVCVCYFVEILKQPQPKISQHLAYMRNAGIVSARREGKWMHYSISRSVDSASAEILQAALGAIATSSQMQADIKQLNQACCQPRRFPLDGAPLPGGVAADCLRT